MLTTAQKTIVKNYIQADPVLSLMPMNSDGDYDIAAALNKPFTPSFIVWKSNVSADEVMRNGIDWTRVDNLSIGKARIWDWMTKLGTFNAGKANIRAGVDATWTGTAADLLVREAVYVHCKRNAIIIEKILSTGTGTTQAPATMGFDGAIQPSDINSARN